MIERKNKERRGGVRKVQTRLSAVVVRKRKEINK